MPFPGITFKVNANELTMGPGTITVLENSFLFEAKNHGHIGFDSNAMSMVRIADINSFDVAYSVQGSIQTASFVTVPRYIRKNEGIEKDVTTNPLEWEMAFWKLHTITGAVVGRIIANRSSTHIEGARFLADEEFGKDLGQAGELIEGLQIQDRLQDEEKQKAKELFRLQLERTILKFTDAWLVGSLSPDQREKVAALCYLSNASKSECGWDGEFGESADEWIQEESLWGSNLKSLIEA